MRYINLVIKYICKVWGCYRNILVCLLYYFKFKGKIGFWNRSYWRVFGDDGIEFKKVGWRRVRGVFLGKYLVDIVEFYRILEYMK